jgi:hypothetical protein
MDAVASDDADFEELQDSDIAIAVQSWNEQPVALSTTSGFAHSVIKV